MHVMYANACRNTPRVSFGRAQRCVSISGCFFFYSTMVAFSVHIQQLYFGPFQLEWNLQSRRNRKEKREKGKVSEGTAENWVPGAAIQRLLLALPSQENQSEAVCQCWASDSPGTEGMAAWERRLGMPRASAQPTPFPGKGWFRASKRANFLPPPSLIANSGWDFWACLLQLFSITVKQHGPFL